MCQGDVDPNAPAQVPALPVIAEIHDGSDGAYLLAGPAPARLNYVYEGRTTDGGPVESSGGTAGSPIDPLLSLDHGGGRSCDTPDGDTPLTSALPSPRVEATHASGSTVEAAVAGGWYLIWTRTAGDLVRITAFAVRARWFARSRTPTA